MKINATWPVAKWLNMSALKRAAIISLELISSCSTCAFIVIQSFSEDAHVDDSQLSIVIIFTGLDKPVLEPLNWCSEPVFLVALGNSNFHWSKSSRLKFCSKSERQQIIVFKLFYLEISRSHFCFCADHVVLLLTFSVTISVNLSIFAEKSDV